MSRHVKWDVRKGGDGATHVTRTEVTRKPGETRVQTDHTKIKTNRR